MKYYKSFNGSTSFNGNNELLNLTEGLEIKVEGKLIEHNNGIYFSAKDYMQYLENIAGTVESFYTNLRIFEVTPIGKAIKSGTGSFTLPSDTYRMAKGVVLGRELDREEFMPKVIALLEEMITYSPKNKVEALTAILNKIK